MWRQGIGTAAGIALLAGLLAGCSGGGKDALKELGKNDQATIKVMYYDENSFFQQYGSLFISKFPNIDVEIANTQSMYSEGYSEDAFQKFVDEKKPDVLMLSADQYEKFAQDGKLYALDSVIEQDKYKLDTMNPAILKLLRDKGNGQIYGFAPSFNNQALFYNVDLFKKYGVELPKDAMSWNEVLDLAKRFPTDGDEKDRVYGFGTQNGSTLFSMLFTISGTNGLRMLNPDGTQLTMSGDGWKQAFQTVTDAVRSKAVYMPGMDQMQSGQTMQEWYMQDPFIAGKAAMMIDYPYKVQNIKQAKESMKELKNLNWGLVTAPVDPSNRNKSNTFGIYNIFAVNAKSANLRAAWEFVKYVSGEDFARVRAKSTMGELLTRTSYNADVDGVSMEPFYKLEPADDMSTGLEKAPDSFYSVISPLVEEQLKAVVDNKKSLDEAMKEIQEKGQAALTEANRKQKEDEAAKKATSPEASSSPAASASASSSATASDGE